MPHELPPLPYPYNALEPHYDEATVKLHHDIHHAGYVKGLNAAEEKMKQALDSGDYASIKAIERELAFHYSGHLLHSIFWTNLAPKAGGKPSGSLAQQIDKDFGSFDKFQKAMSASAAAVEGSGWALLCWDPVVKRLTLLQTEKHQNYAQWGVVPLFVIDVWEHAYYLKYQNRRAEFIEAIWKLANWSDVQRRLDAARK